MAEYAKAFEALSQRTRHFAEWCGYASQCWSDFYAKLPNNDMNTRQLMPSPIVREEMKQPPTNGEGL